MYKYMNGNLVKHNITDCSFMDTLNCVFFLQLKLMLAREVLFQSVSFKGMKFRQQNGDKDFWSQKGCNTIYVTIIALRYKTAKNLFSPAEKD